MIYVRRSQSVPRPIRDHATKSEPLAASRPCVDNSQASVTLGIVMPCVSGAFADQPQTLFRTQSSLASSRPTPHRVRHAVMSCRPPLNELAISTAVRFTSLVVCLSPASGASTRFGIGRQQRRMGGPEVMIGIVHRCVGARLFLCRSGENGYDDSRETARSAANGRVHVRSLLSRTSQQAQHIQPSELRRCPSWFPT